MILDNCRVPGSCLLGGKEKLDERLARVREGKRSTSQAAMATFEASRPGVGAQALGIARAAYEYSLDYAIERRQFGKAIIENQAIAFKLADMKVRIDAAPVAAMREYLTAMDAAPMLAAEGGETSARVIAALGPKMLALGAELADGVHPYLVTPEHTARARAIVGEKFIGVEQAVVLGNSREEFLTRAHEHLNHYTGLDNYRNSWRRFGFTDEDFVRGGSERLCDAMVVHGDEAAILARIDEHRDAGADHICLQVLGATMATPPLDDWRRLAPVVTGR